MPIRILLADDHNLVRAGIRSLLEQLPGVEVVAEADDGYEALTQIGRHNPDVVLIDIAMPRLNGLETTMRIKKEYPNVRVLIVSMHLNEEYVVQALSAGASGYLLKDAATAELEIAVKAVARNDTYLSPAVSKKVIEDYTRRVGGADRLVDKLTSRQRETLQLIAEGNTTKEIAEILCVSIKTVESHRSQLMDRLNIHDIAGLVRYALRMGLISVDR